MRNIKPRYQGPMLSFSRNEPNRRYYLNGMVQGTTIHSYQWLSLKRGLGGCRHGFKGFDG